ncbi:MATE family efflux transporter [Desulfonema ishimotonii]|uniref:MATE family efflux transporter n=1 Tax=Desulfonema ishimotonii TaxID=45657 RepID=A0A401G0J3_9BACT|nr:MATE family efflux transporter [Desulfonema ishimotonii]GBC62745.1 MATE family efflux transporter [Desulfonema ishimotonii]
MTPQNENELTTAPIPKLIRQITIPVSIGMFFNTMYNVVDTWFGGMISTQALAAMSLSLPVFFIIISVGSGFSTGATALIGNALGAGNRDRASHYAVQSLTFGVLISVALSFTGMAIAPFLFRLLGATDEYLIICMAYMNVLFWGTIFFLMVYMLKGILAALGDTRTYRNFLIVGFLLNIALDPWFIFGGFGLPPLGVTGIALATVLVQVIGCLYLGLIVLRTGMFSDKTRRDALPERRAFREILRQGGPASLNILTIALGSFVITWFVSKFGKEAVAAYGIGLRVEQIVLLPTIGLSTTTLTLVSQNHGAGLAGRVTESLRKSLTYGAAMTAVGSLLVFFLAEQFMGFFSDDRAVVEIGTIYLKVEAIVLYAYVILFVSVAALQGVRRPMFAVYIGLFRQILAPVAVFHLLTEVFHFGVQGIWWGILGVTWTAALIAFFYSRRVIRKVVAEI